MIDINDLKSIEKYFSENLETPLFPILSDLYFQKGDYKRSKKVCEIGLLNNPRSSIAYYILAKISLIEENLKEAEKYLEKSINLNTTNLSSMNLLFFIQKELKRSKTKIKKNVLNILLLDSENHDCNEWLNKYYKEEPSKKIETKKETIETKKIKNLKIDAKINQKSNFKEKHNESINKKIEIDRELASMTLFNIYKSQGYYKQALQVLEILKKKENNKTINEEITILKKLIEESK